MTTPNFTTTFPSNHEWRLVAPAYTELAAVSAAATFGGVEEIGGASLELDFLRQHLWPHRGRLAGLAKFVEATAGSDPAILNAWLTERGSAFRYAAGLDGIGASAIGRLGGKWSAEGKRGTLRLKEGDDDIEYPAAKFAYPERGVEVFSIEGQQACRQSLQWSKDVIVHVPGVDALQGLEFALALIGGAPRTPVVNEGVLWPQISMEREPDYRELSSLTIGGRNLVNAHGKIDLKMDHKRIQFRQEVHLEMAIGLGMGDKRQPNLWTIDQPFVTLGFRPGEPWPLYCILVTKDFWKKPQFND